MLSTIQVGLGLWLATTQLGHSLPRQRLPRWGAEKGGPINICWLLGKKEIRKQEKRLLGKGKREIVMEGGNYMSPATLMPLVKL